MFSMACLYFLAQASHILARSAVLMNTVVMLSRHVVDQLADIGCLFICLNIKLWTLLSVMHCPVFFTQSITQMMPLSPQVSGDVCAPTPTGIVPSYFIQVSCSPGFCGPSSGLGSGSCKRKVHHPKLQPPQPAAISLPEGFWQPWQICVSCVPAQAAYVS